MKHIVITEVDVKTKCLVRLNRNAQRPSMPKIKGLVH
jgi:hypothetical protein